MSGNAAATISVHGLLGREMSVLPGGELPLVLEVNNMFPITRCLWEVAARHGVRGAVVRVGDTTVSFENTKVSGEHPRRTILIGVDNIFVALTVCGAVGRYCASCPTCNPTVTPFNEGVKIEKNLSD